MQRTLGAVLVALVLAVAPTTSAVAKSPAQSDQIPGQYIVMLRDGQDAAATAAEQAVSTGAVVRHVYRTAIDGYAASMSPAAAALVARDPRVLSVQPDRRVQAAAQSTPTGVNRVNADLSPTAAIDEADTRVDADVAVIDTGIDPYHPDLNVYEAGETNCSLPLAGDLNGHGTHVAGTIGALDNTSGVVGVAPGARLWPVKVLNPLGIGFTSDVVCGIDYVTAHADEIEVANMSLGGDGADDGNCGLTNGDIMHQAICRSVAAGVTYVVAAGNDHTDAKDFVPAAYDEVITVSAMADFDGAPGGAGSPTCRDDQDDTFADFSNYGPDVDLVAPGVCIDSTFRFGGYETLSGTSMATPHVTGAAALYLAKHPSASPGEVKSALQSAGSTDWTPAEDPDGVHEPRVDVTGR